MSNRRQARVDRDIEAADHLDDLPDGAGCFEIWSHLSDRRKRSACD